MTKAYGKQLDPRSMHTLGADAKQEDIKIIPFFFTIQAFANNRVKSKVNLVKQILKV
jgi:hypothetical protein